MILTYVNCIYIYIYRSAVRTEIGGSLKSRVDTPRMMKCDVNLPFWISWTDGYVQIGSGEEILSHQFLSWNNGNGYIVKSLSLSSGDTADATWQVPMEEGEIVCLKIFMIE